MRKFSTIHRIRRVNTNENELRMNQRCDIWNHDLRDAYQLQRETNMRRLIRRKHWIHYMNTFLSRIRDNDSSIKHCDVQSFRYSFLRQIYLSFWSHHFVLFLLRLNTQHETHFHVYRAMHSIRFVLWFWYFILCVFIVLFDEFAKITIWHLRVIIAIIHFDHIISYRFYVHHSMNNAFHVRYWICTWNTQSIELIISRRHSLIRRKQTSLHLIASICDISRDHFCRCDVNISNDRNAHCDVCLHFRALFCTSLCRLCERLFLHLHRRFSFQRLHLHWRLHFSLSIWSHHFVLFLLHIVWYATRNCDNAQLHAMHQNVNSFDSNMCES